MPKSETSKKPSRKSSPRERDSRFGDRLVAEAQEAAAAIRSEIERNEYEIKILGETEVAAIRARLELSQAAFAKSFGLDLGVVQAWEQKRRRPDRCARILLAVIAKEPDAVRRALAA